MKTFFAVPLELILPKSQTFLVKESYFAIAAVTITALLAFETTMILTAKATKLRR